MNSALHTKLTYRDYRTAHDFFIDPETGDVCDLYSLEVVVPNAERSEDRSPTIHSKTWQIYDSWTGEALNLNPRQIIQLKNDADGREFFRRQREERRRKEQQEKYDE